MLMKLMPLANRSTLQGGGPLLWMALVALSASTGCMSGSNTPDSVIRGSMPDTTSEAGPDLLVVSATKVWSETGIELAAGESINFTARGEIVAGPGRGQTEATPARIPPEGTFLFDETVIDRNFPLPAAGGGPAPCYGLIGRIGDGEPFFIGRTRSIVAQNAGKLQLGVNDFDVSDNSGEFLVQIELGGTARPVLQERIVETTAEGAAPAPNSSVVVFYVDGLRPDVIREMAALGHLPNIRRQFLENGAWVEHAFTAFPSDTITSNGTMWTGCFADRHGIKGQVSFSRRRLDAQSFLDPFGPQRSAQWLSPSGADLALRSSQATAIGLTLGTDARDEWLDLRHSSVPPLYELLRNRGHDWAVGMLPVMTEVPPPLWSRSMARYMPYFQAQKAWEYMDDANADYAIRGLLARREPVTIIWLPETDSCSHKCSRGQFGVARRTIARVDELVGGIVEELRAQGRLESTYLLMVSDHGHVGGHDRHLSHFDLATDFFFRPRVVNSQGQWAGGGLGVSVHMHRHWNRHPEDGAKEFVFIDAESDGVARVYLPRGHYRSHAWQGEERPGDLLRYRLDDGRDLIDLPRSLASIHAVNGGGVVDQPVDLVLMKLTDTSLLLTTNDRGQAVIERRRSEDGRWEYRYFTVMDVQPTEDGHVHYEEHWGTESDPLELTQSVSPSLLAEFHDERFWLELTCKTRYPDSVVTLARHMLWDEELEAVEREHAPDLVVTARSGWYFSTDASPGTMHGYPLPEAMRASFFVSGPRVRRGARITAPARLADLTPTILDMVGLWDEASQETTFDGHPLRSMYRGSVEYAATPTPVYWPDVDLQAWRRLTYTPLERSTLMPRSIHRPSALIDINNIAYGAALIPDMSIFRLMDDAISPISGGRQPMTALADNFEGFLRKRRNPLVSQVAQVPDVPGVALADYSVTSQGNLQRMDRAIDWVQNAGESIDQKLAAPIKRETLPLTRPINRSIDAAQQGFWELYRFGQRTAIKVVDEIVLNGVEDSTGRVLNAMDPIPNEVRLSAEDSGSGIQDSGAGHIPLSPAKSAEDSRDAIRGRGPG
ncbi:MAG: alkaline phosphatase family protein [Planctomycetaceae bacterium]|nr:alkaline phosphatase family protein [Planctomycetaceae bacterium]